MMTETRGGLDYNEGTRMTPTPDNMYYNLNNLEISLHKYLSNLYKP